MRVDNDFQDHRLPAAAILIFLFVRSVFFRRTTRINEGVKEFKKQANLAVSIFLSPHKGKSAAAGCAGLDVVVLILTRGACRRSADFKNNAATEETRSQRSAGSGGALATINCRRSPNAR